MRAALSTMALLAFVAPAQAQPREISGQAGLLGEWELTATVTERIANGMQELVGPMSMKHVGLCTVDGPEEKAGELRVRIFSSSTRMKATLLIDGTECTYEGTLKDSYNGLMSCPDRRSVPLTLWIK